MTSGLSEALAEHLLRADGQEDLCFALWRPSSGARRMTALVVSVLLPEHENDRSVHGNVELHDQFLLRALAEATRRKCGLALFHSHPVPGWQGLSRDDWDTEAGMAGAVSAATGLPLVGATWATDGSCSARIWRRVAARRYEAEWCEAVRIVGKRLDVCFDDNQSPPPTFRPELRRTVSAWGPQVQQKLMRLHYGIIGVGSVGSIVSEALARMGAQRVSLLDFDSLETVNLDRTLNASACDAARHRSKVDVAADAFRRHATARKVQVDGFEHSVVETAGYKVALDCDILFCCVDRPWPRFILNSISFAHLIPVIDGGVLVETKDEGRRLKRAAWRAHAVLPGRGCLECLDQYDPADVALECEGMLDDPVYIKGLPVDHRLRRNENVFPFALSTASMEILQALSILIAPFGVANIGGQYYDFVSGRTDVSRIACKDGCPFPTYVALGDAVPIVPTALHRAADLARISREKKRRSLLGRLRGLFRR